MIRIALMLPIGSLLFLVVGALAVFVGVSALAWIVLTVLVDALWRSPQQQQGHGKAQGHGDQQPTVRGYARAGVR